MSPTARLIGPARSVGEALGRAQRELIRAEMERSWDPSYASSALAEERATRLRDILSRVAPWWIEKIHDG